VERLGHEKPGVVKLKRGMPRKPTLRSAALLATGRAVLRRWG
jgi:hypothetical protein